MALTATATPRVRGDIKSNLHLGSAHPVPHHAARQPSCVAGCAEFVRSFERPNLKLGVERKPPGPLATAMRQLAAAVTRSGGATLVYALTTKEVDDLCACLLESGVRAGR